VRPFEAGDEDGLYTLMADWGDDHSFPRGTFDASLADILARGDSQIVVALRGGRILGYAQSAVYRALGNEAALELRQLLVAAEARGLGIGASIMEFVEARARECGAAKVILYSQVKRSRAHLFYEGRGYHMGKVSKYYEKRLEA